MQLVTKAFDGDKLEAVNHLSQLFKPVEKEQFLTMYSSKKKLQQWGTDIGWVISAIVGVIGAITSSVLKH